MCRRPQGFHPRSFRGVLLLSLGVTLLVVQQPAGWAAAADLEAAKTRFFSKTESLRWVAYTPSSFDPHSNEPFLRDDIESDLRAMKSAGFNGLVTYSCSPLRLKPSDQDAGETKSVLGLDDVPELAKKLGFRGFIAGVWDPENERETAAIKRLAGAQLIDAACVGNEGLDDRYGWETLRKVMRSLRARLRWVS